MAHSPKAAPITHGLLPSTDQSTHFANNAKHATPPAAHHNHAHGCTTGIAAEAAYAPAAAAYLASAVRGAAEAYFSCRRLNTSGSCWPCVVTTG